MTTRRAPLLVVVLCWAVVAACLATILVMMTKWDHRQQQNKEFAAVCTYEGGEVEGDVCVKDDQVILTFEEWEAR